MLSIDSSNHVGFAIRIEGLDEVKRALRELPKKLERNVVRGGLRAAAKIVADEAKRRVPVRRGFLQKSIRISSRVKNGLVTVSVKAGGKGARHAHLVELGTKPHLIGRRGFKSAPIRHPGAKPKPYMKPAFESKVQAAIATFVDYVQRRLPKELEKLNGGNHG